MLIKEITDTNVPESTEDAPLADVYGLIQNGPKNYVIVVDSSQHRVPIGVVSEHTICESLVRNVRNTKGLCAANVMSSRIRRVSENEHVEKCRDLIACDAHAIVVVDDRRRFQGVVEPAAIGGAIRARTSAEQPSSVFGSLLGQAIPASVEIPAFGWVK